MSRCSHSLLTTEACARPTTSKKRRLAPSQWALLLLLVLLLGDSDEDEVADEDTGAGVTERGNEAPPADNTEDVE
jgi:hypothetical protein